MNLRRTSRRTARLLVASATAMGVLITASYRAIVIEPMPRALEPFMPPDANAAWTDPSPMPDGVFFAALARNPFNESRQRPASRFPMPGSIQPTFAAPPIHQSSYRLAGTTALGGGKGFAMIEVNGSSARLYRVGDSVGTAILRAVDRGEARLRHGDSTVVIQLSRGNQ